jgi:hypothetical protein
LVPERTPHELSHLDEHIHVGNYARGLSVRWVLLDRSEQDLVPLDARLKGWHHHMVMVMLAHHFLVWVRVG